MTDEHARFIATYPGKMYSKNMTVEERWQMVLDQRRRWQRSQSSLRDWQVEQDAIQPDATTALKSHIRSLEKQVKELQGQRPVVIDNNREERL